MKSVSIFQYGYETGLNDKVAEWIRENEDNIIEIIDIEYQQYDNVYVATIRYYD